MISETFFNGRSRELVTNTNQSFKWGYRIILVTSQIATRVYSLVDARTLRPGLYQQIVANVSTNAFQITDSAGGNLVTSLTQNQWAFFHLVSNATAAGTWITYVRTRLT